MIQKINIESMEIPEEIGFGGRVETGAVEFTYPNNPHPDWTGLFIRGDNCIGLNLHIEALENYFEKVKGQLQNEDVTVLFALSNLRGIKEIIRGEVVHTKS